ncbi:MAG: cation:proton antiporter [Candidatus Thermoplasmatota archaeon]|nr:cation:proton antiporter [Candidatus Thermoplasmatota archaeon]
MLDLQTGFLINMAIVIAVAAIIIVLFHRLKQPLILGYLVAGMVAGPFVISAEYTVGSGVTRTVISAQPVIEMLARLGIVLLTFSIGLEFSLKQLRKIGITVIAAAALEITLMIGVGYQLGRALGWSGLESTLLGAMLSVASTMIIVRSLRETGGLDNERARLVVGLLIVEDFAAVLILAAVSGLISQGGIEPAQLADLLLKMGIFLAASIVFGLAVVPRLVDYVGRQRSGELLVLTVLGLCFSMAVFSRWIGFSEAIGAFVMGVIVSESKYLGDVMRRVEPVRDLFGAIFFITVGMLVDLHLFLNFGFLLTAAIIALVFIVAKMLSCSVSTFMFGFGARNSIGAGMSMTAVGEFSLMIAAVAIGSTAISSGIHLYPTIVIVTTISALVVPYSVRFSDRATKIVEERAPRSLLLLASYFNLVVRNMRTRSRSSLGVSNEMRSSISRLFVYIVTMVSASAIALNAAPKIPDFVHLVGGNEELVLLAVITGSMIVIASALFGIWSRTIRIIEISTSEAMLGTRSAERIGYKDTAKALKWIFLAVYAIVGFVLVSPLVNSLVQQGLIFALLAASIIIVAIVALWGSVKTVDKKLVEIFERRGPSALEVSSDLDEIEDIIAAMERGMN